MKVFAALFISRLLTCFCCFGQEVLLSDVDEGYKYVEDMQKHFRDSTQNAMTMEEYKAVMRREIARSGEAPPSDSLLTALTSRVSTKYEIPTVYNSLKTFYEEVEGAAKRLGYKIDQPVKLGSLPIREVNASTFVGDKTSGFYTIFVNVDYLLFTFEITKTVAATLPLHRKEVSGDVASNLKYLTDYLASNPDALREFVAVLLSFQYGEGYKRSPLGEDTRKVLAYYTEAMEVFAIAHEYGHIYLKHTQGQFSLHRKNTLAAGPCAEAPGTDENEWQQEIAADLVAYRIIKELYRERKNDVCYVALLTAPEFYFLTRQTLDEVAATVEGCAPNAVPEEERSAVEKLKGCAGKSIPELEKDIREVAAQGFRKRHPHPFLRAAMAHSLLPVAYETELQADSSRLYLLLNRNLALLWVAAKPRLEQAIEVMKARNQPLFAPR